MRRLEGSGTIPCAGGAQEDPRLYMNQNNDKMRVEIDERLAALAVRVWRMAPALSSHDTAGYLVDPLVRTALAAYTVHGDRGAASFEEHLRNRLQAAVEIHRGLLLVRRLELVSPGSGIEEMIDDAEVLVKMFFSGVRTMESRKDGNGSNGARRFETAAREGDDDPFEASWSSGAKEPVKAPPAPPARPVKRGPGRG